MAREFNTTIWMCQNCPLQEGDARTWAWDNRGTQYESVLQDAGYYGQSVKFTNYSRLPTESGVEHTLRLNISPTQGTADDHLSYNYLVFCNNSYVEASAAPKKFFAFIRTSKYVNENTVEYTYIIDDLQTYMHDFTVIQADVDRQHIEVDEIFASDRAETDLPQQLAYIATSSTAAYFETPSEIYAIFCEPDTLTQTVTTTYSSGKVVNILTGDGTGKPGGLGWGIYNFKGTYCYYDKSSDKAIHTLQGIPCNYDVIFATRYYPEQDVSESITYNKKGIQSVLAFMDETGLTSRIYSIQQLPIGAEKVIEAHYSLEYSDTSGVYTHIMDAIPSTPPMYSSDYKNNYSSFNGENSAVYQNHFIQLKTGNMVNYKMYQFPFTKFSLVCGSDEYDLKPEKASGSVSGNVAWVKLIKNIALYPSPGACIVLPEYYTPREYEENPTIPKISKSNTFNTNETGTLPFTVDSYGEYLQTQKNANEITASAQEYSATNTLISSTLTNGLGLITSGVGKDVSGLASSGVAIVQGVISYNTAMKNISSKLAASEAAARDATDKNIQGKINSLGFMDGTSGNGNVLTRKVYAHDVMKAIDNYFSLFGYAVDDTITSPKVMLYRPYYNFFMAKSLNLKTENIPQVAVARIKQRFGEGILFINADQPTAQEPQMVLLSPLSYAVDNTPHE